MLLLPVFKEVDIYRMKPQHMRFSDVSASSPSLPVSRRAKPRSSWSIVDLFAGIGGVAQGFMAQGEFEVRALVDIDLNARRTFLHNHPSYPRANYLRRDVAKLTGKHLRALVGRVDGLVGCPPCQGVSVAGKRSPDDPRNYLLGHYLRLVEELRPDFFFFENVPAVLGRADFRQRLRRLASVRRYRVWTGVVNAAFYGLPQSRQRALIVGFAQRTGVVPGAPPPTHCGRAEVFDYASQRMARPLDIEKFVPYREHDLLGSEPTAQPPLFDQAVLEALPPLVTVADAIGDLPVVQAGERGEGNHHPWDHRPELVERLSRIPEGGNVEGTGRCVRYFSQAYGRLHPRGLARTITTNFHNPGSGRYTHYKTPRSLTVREAARLQGFGDEFKFIGDKTAQERLIGNAFPKTLSRVVADHIAVSLKHLP